MKYALIKMPDGYIDIIDNSTNIGKGRVCKLINEGGKPAGTTDSDLPVGALKAGLEHNRNTQLDKLYSRIRLAQEVLDGNITWDQVHPQKLEGSETQ